MNLSTQLLVAKKWLKIVIITVYSTGFKSKNKNFLIYEPLFKNKF